MNHFSALFNKFVAFLVAAVVAAALAFAGSTPAAAQDKPTDTTKQTVTGTWFSSDGQLTQNFCNLLIQCQLTCPIVVSTTGAGTADGQSIKKVKEQRQKAWRLLLERIKKIEDRLDALEGAGYITRAEFAAILDEFQKVVANDINTLNLKINDVIKDVEDLKMRVMVLERRVDDHDLRLSVLEVSFLDQFASNCWLAGGPQISYTPIQAGLATDLPVYDIETGAAQGNETFLFRGTNYTGVGAEGAWGCRHTSGFTAMLSTSLTFGMEDGMSMTGSTDGLVSSVYTGTASFGGFISPEFALTGGPTIYGHSTLASPTGSGASGWGAGLEIGAWWQFSEFAMLHFSLTFAFDQVEYSELYQDQITPDVILSERHHQEGVALTFRLGMLFGALPTAPTLIPTTPPTTDHQPVGRW